MSHFSSHASNICCSIEEIGVTKVQNILLEYFDRILRDYASVRGVTLVSYSLFFLHEIR